MKNPHSLIEPSRSTRSSTVRRVRSSSQEIRRTRRGNGLRNLDFGQRREYGRLSTERGDIRNRSALGIAVLASLLVLALAVPAHAAPRLRLYRGETSQGDPIKFVVAKTDAGRFVRQIDLSGMHTCEDQTTTVWGIDFFLGRREVPITGRALSYDVNFGDLAVHVSGDLGSLRGEGTASLISAELTEDEQAQLCTTGDLTWTVEFVRVL